MNPLQFILKSLLRKPRRRQGASGFTLIELLVGILLTFLIITPLLGLVTSMMNTERQEQAKVSTQQEIQAALDYIAQDLQQAVYIYDADGLSRGNSANPAQSGILDQIPPAQAATGCNANHDCVPVLAFWKRRYLDKTDTVRDRVGDVRIGAIQDSTPGSDRFVYSLVVYYLIKDRTPQANSTWSKVARLGRFEISDGIVEPNGGTARSRTNNGITTFYNLLPDDGFASFTTTTVGGAQVSSVTLVQRMNSWRKFAGENYTQSVVTLIDYIDDTPLNEVPADVQAQFTPPANDITNPNTTGLASTYCSDNSTGRDTAGNAVSSRVPPDPIIPASLNTGSFYACVNPLNAQGQSVVQVFLRGNALPRIGNNPTAWKINDFNKPAQLANRPIASVRVTIRGLLGQGG